MLEGLDEHWIEAGTRRYVSYTNLDPGTYTLRVRGSNNDGVWNTDGTELVITIVPPYWRTWWFRILVVAAVAGFLFVMYRYRVNKLLEIERIRTSIASDLHDDIGSTLTEIALYSDVGTPGAAAPPVRRPAVGRRTYETLLAARRDRHDITVADRCDERYRLVHRSPERFLRIPSPPHPDACHEDAGGQGDQLRDRYPGISHITPASRSGRAGGSSSSTRKRSTIVLRHAQATRVTLTLRREGRMLIMSDRGQRYRIRSRVRAAGGTGCTTCGREHVPSVAN